jgi:hypothetical protein
MFLLSMSLLLLGASGVGWTTDGGSGSRTGVSVLSQDLSAVAAHQPVWWRQGADPSDSSVENALIGSMLVTSQGLIVTANGSCAVSVYEDPAFGGGSAGGAPPPALGSWFAPNPETCRLGGLVLDDDDVAYFLDRGNRTVHALAVSARGAALLFSVQLQPALAKGAISGATGMLVVPASIAADIGRMLWVPLTGTAVLGGGGYDGMALAIGLDAGADNPAFRVPTLVPKATDADCQYPIDLGEGEGGGAGGSAAEAARGSSGDSRRGAAGAPRG